MFAKNILAEVEGVSEANGKNGMVLDREFSE